MGRQKEAGWLDASFISADVQETNGVMAAIYPNPAGQYFRIELPDGRHEIRAFNAVGKLVRSASANGSYEMDTRSWINGLYTVEAVNTATREKWRGRVIIQK